MSHLEQNQNFENNNNSPIQHKIELSDLAKRLLEKSNGHEGDVAKRLSDIISRAAALYASK